MGIKELWPLIEPYAQKKPISTLRGKVVAIDLAGWVCESLNVVEYFVHPRHHLKNLFFRTCYLIWEEVTPVFVLEGVAPELKAQVIAKRNEIQFRGVKPKEPKTQPETQPTAAKGRTRFNYVLKQCESLLKCMGIQCVQAPGEAEAYAAFLNKKGLVDAVISQDSDCFAYGAQCVLRNFSISMQGAQAGSCGSFDMYDMRYICEHMDFGQHKIIIMGLLCGCDYCPEGVGGVGRESVIKLFNKYKESEIFDRIRSWRKENNKYTALELRVDDKNICVNCGHIGRTVQHTKNGCSVCRTVRGCDDSLWREKRLCLKAELMLRKKAMENADFPNEQIIAEFLSELHLKVPLNLNWQRPLLVKFVKKMSNLLQWSEIYSFQKFLPLVTRWQLRNAQLLQTQADLATVKVAQFVKKRTVKGILSLEILWMDLNNCLQNLIPEEQIEAFKVEHNGSLTQLWSTVEPWYLVELAYPAQLAAFVKSKEKPVKEKKLNSRTKKPKMKNTVKVENGLIERFLIKQNIQKTPPREGYKSAGFTSTPTASPLPLTLSDDEEAVSRVFNMSDIINAMVATTQRFPIDQVEGQQLYYEPLAKDLNRQILKDDLDLMIAKKRLHTPMQENNIKKMKKNVALDDSFDVMVNQKNHRLEQLIQRSKQLCSSLTKSFNEKSHMSQQEDCDVLCESLSFLDIQEK